MNVRIIGVFLYGGGKLARDGHGLTRMGNVNLMDIEERLMPPKWLIWSRALQAIAQSGLSNADKIHPFDVEQYKRIRKIASEMMAAGCDTEIEPILDLFEKESGYASPKAAVRGVVFHEDKVLLVKHTRTGHTTTGAWVLPGGHAEVNEPPGYAVRREIFEETGYDTKVIKLLAVTDSNRSRPTLYHRYNLFFRCEIMGGDPKTSWETEEIEFFSEEEIEGIPTWGDTAAQIIGFYKHLRNPSLPTEFE